MLYRADGGKISAVKEDGFRKEKDLQTFVEQHLDELLKLKFLATEFWADNDYRLDTAAYDPEANAFVVIEDKNLANHSLVDQGFAYLNAMLGRKEKWVLLYNQVMKENRNVDEFDWSQSRVVFISPIFTKYQKDATKFADMPFELYELKKYRDIYLWNNVTEKIRETSVIKTASNSPAEKKTLDELKVYTESDCFTADTGLRDKYEELRDSILSLPETSMKISKSQIGFYTNQERIATISPINPGPKTTSFKLDLNNNRQPFIDPYKMIKDITGNEWGKLTGEVKIDEKSDIDVVMHLVKQCHDKVLG